MPGPDIEFTSLGLAVLDEIGFPGREPLTDVLGGSGVTLKLRKERGKLSTRGLLEFQYTTPILPAKNEWLEGAGSLASKTFHFLEGLAMLENRVSALLNMRVGTGITEAPLIIWEPAPLLCKRENLSACLGAACMVDVFSPNHLELLTLCGKPLQPVPDKSEIEGLTQRFLDSGVGSEGAGTVVVRAAEY
ncbi:hypothetical protein EMPG_12055 [Blastomyces silverae]|uniref:Uncharacterized protein n=1 Tax=Blastomyces silverae TaxID=2060906 RepID=A0A0H1BNR7_9EURO|nr:hypothetical protein EMPG_12055 [Blastomyces silverae]